MAIPVWEAVSTLGELASSGTVAAALPGAPANGYYVLVFCETANQVIAVPTFTINTATTFTEIGTQTGTGAAGLVGSVRLGVYGAFVNTNAATETINLSAGVVDHLFYRIATVSGVDPVAVEATGQKVETTSTTALAWPTGLSTTTNDALVILALALADDSASVAKVGAVTAANLAAITEQFDETVATGAGGGLACITGTLATAGAIGSPTATAANSWKHEYRTFALIGDTGGSSVPSSPVDLKTATKIGVKTYSGPDKKGVTRARSANNVHYLHPAARMLPYTTQAGDSSQGHLHYWKGTDFEGFGGFSCDIKWNSLEPEDGIYDFTEIRGHLDFCAESRVFCYFNIEWKHFSIPHYGNVVPEYMAEAATGCYRVPYTSGDGSNTPVPGDILTHSGGAVCMLIGGLLGTGTSSAYQATGNVYLDVISGTLSAGDLSKNGSEICNLTNGGTQVLGGQVRVGDGAGFYAQYMCKYVRDRLYRFLDAVCREFGHHPWFGGIEFPEIAGAAENSRQAHTSKFAASATEYATVTTNGNCFVNSENEGAWWQEQCYGRLLRDNVRKWTGVTWLGGPNLFPARSSARYNIGFTNVFTPGGDDMPDTFTHPNLACGGPDILYENPARAGLNQQSYPQYSRVLSGATYKGTKADGSPHTTNAVLFSDKINPITGAVSASGTQQRYYHKCSMQHDSMKHVENGGMSLSDTTRWGIDYLWLQMIQWNYQKGPTYTTQNYDFGDMKVAVNAYETPTPATTYLPPAISNKTFGSSGLATFTGTTANYFPASANAESAGWTVILGFRVTTLSGNQDVFYSATGTDYTHVYVSAAGSIIAKIKSGATISTLTIAGVVSAGTNYVVMLVYEAHRGTTAGDPDADDGAGIAGQSVGNGYKLAAHNGTNEYTIQRSTTIGTRHLGASFTCWGGANVTAGNTADFAGGRVVWRSLAGTPSSTMYKELRSALKVTTTVG